jgi:membrane-associated phospholipid phosphatase
VPEPHQPIEFGRRVLWGYAVLGVVALVLLSATAHAQAFFAFDPPVEQAIQAWIPESFGRVLDGVSWVGFPPQVDAIVAVGILIVLALRYRWEAACLTFAGVVGAASWFGLALLIERPRPSPDLVHVERVLGFSSYPSGHVVNLTAFFGSLLVLSWLGMRPTWYRAIMQILGAVLIACIGVARIYSGEHWPSDVLAGYLQGSVVVALTVSLYLRRHLGRPGHPLRRRRSA